jgi:hypothetical protein
MNAFYIGNGKPRLLSTTIVYALAVSNVASERLAFLSTSSPNPLRSTSSLALRGGETSGLPFNSTDIPANEGQADSTRIMIEDPDTIIGGGAINEKKRTFRQGTSSSSDASIGGGLASRGFRATDNQAHFLHAMEGLDRYPNYLARWKPEDAEELEQALIKRLDTVREQRRFTESHRERILAVVDCLCEKEQDWIALLTPPSSWGELQQSGILHDRAQNAIFRSKFFRPSRNHTVPSVQQVLDGTSKVELDAGYLEDLMDEEASEVYSFPLLSESFCDRIQAYIRRITKELDECNDSVFSSVARGSFRNLDNLRLGWLNDLLFQLVVRPISRQLFQETEMGGENGDLDWRHGYITAYAAHPDANKPRQRLIPHTDDAEITLNVCIGDVFEGGQLTFRGLRGTEKSGQVVVEYTPERGRALLHAGRQLHEVTEVTSGDRFALIMWTRSWGGIRSATCPCCWLNRRQDTDQTSCTCSSRWN